MLDGFSLDQLRTFIAAAETGSFSAAGRKLGRAQSVVSQTIANLEGQIGLLLFERTGRVPVLTERGRSLLADAWAVADSIDAFKVRAKGMNAGLEPELSLVADVMFPMPVLTSAARAFAEAFPSVPLRLQVEALGAVAEPVIEGRCRIGLFVSLPLLPTGLMKEALLRVKLLMVAAPTHPLATERGPIPAEILARHTQLVLSDRSRLSEGREFGVFSPRTWRLSDLGAKHAFLLAGLGWGGMPFSAVERDIAAGTLVPLQIAAGPETAMPEMPVYAIYRADAPPGPAGRWMIEHIKGYEIGAASSDEAVTNAPDNACAMSD
ncbi:LysR family transcriptional regulator [Methylobacterium sp. Leaf93]|uniref:LysR family transcriptional regulator n=1 Tax=Methylobacterium sp. Leaf93 TaxID=1736249 RepID=UPI0006F85A94|nr:LysR family transcriptional regulator [Methylobacterium sp. Leaf93]KQP15409.1 LysR family transcriptional regulator [Methylobacterium sp. Leaf93]